MGRSSRVGAGDYLTSGVVVDFPDKSPKTVVNIVLADDAVVVD